MPALVRCLLFVLALALPGAVRAGGEPPLAASYFNRAFAPDFIASADDALPGEKQRLVKVFFRVADLGVLKVTSGKISAADPFVGIDAKPFSQPIPIGDFPVRLAVLHGNIGRGRVAFARVDFSDAPAVRWQMALTEGQDTSTLKSGELFGYAVDSGLGAYFDEQAGIAAAAKMKDDETYLENLLEQGQVRGAKERGASGAFRLIVDSGPANIAAFDSGWGDGVYASYFGFDADGKLAALVTDFDIIDWGKVRD